MEQTAYYLYLSVITPSYSQVKVRDKQPGWHLYSYFMFKQANIIIVCLPNRLEISLREDERCFEAHASGNVWQSEPSSSHMLLQPHTFH